MKYFFYLTLFLTTSMSALAQEKTNGTVTSIGGIIDELLDQIVGFPTNLSILEEQ